MPAQKRLVATLLITCSLTLLATAVVKPIRTTDLATVSLRPNGLQRDFALFPSHPTDCLYAATDVDSKPLVNALPIENEERDWAEARDESRSSWMIFGSFRQRPGRLRIPFRSTNSSYPLRC